MNTDSKSLDTKEAGHTTVDPADNDDSSLNPGELTLEEGEA